MRAILGVVLVLGCNSGKDEISSLKKELSSAEQELAKSHMEEIDSELNAEVRALENGMNDILRAIDRREPGHPRIERVCQVGVSFVTVHVDFEFAPSLGPEIWSFSKCNQAYCPGHRAFVRPMQKAITIQDVKDVDARLTSNKDGVAIIEWGNTENSARLVVNGNEGFVTYSDTRGTVAKARCK